MSNSILKAGDEQVRAWQKMFQLVPLFEPSVGWHAVAKLNCPGIQESSLNFEVKSGESVGFFWSESAETFAVSCRNFYKNSAMDARSFGMAITIVWVNGMAHCLAEEGQLEAARTASDLYHKLVAWAFSSDSFDQTAIYDFIN